MLPDEAVPRNDDEDEEMFPDLVDQSSKQVIVPFVNDDSDEEAANVDMIPDEYDGDDMPALEWDINSPNLAVGTRFKDVSELRKAVKTFCIRSNNVFNIEKSERRKYTVHYPDERCLWKLHATRERGKKMIQVIG